MRRRSLTSGDEVVIIFTKDLGYVELNAVFQEYRTIELGKAFHPTPIFKWGENEILGIDCFWALKSEIKNAKNVENLRKKAILVQAKALELGYLYEYNIPEKIEDKGIRRMAEENITFTKLVEKHGFDPRDEIWIERELAVNDRERNWFKFERQVKIPVKWSNIEDLTNVFNDQFDDEAGAEELYKLSVKRARFLMGSYIIRMSWNKDVEKWKAEAKEFEKRHREIEGRLWKWAIDKEGNFPTVKTLKSLEFRCDGSLFSNFIEKLPELFRTPDCTELAENITLRVVAYDSETNNIRLDFPDDVRTIAKGGDSAFKTLSGDRPWLEDQYVILCPPEKIESHLDKSKF